MFERLKRQPIALVARALFRRKRTQTGRISMRQYQAAKSSRLTAGWSVSNTSSDSELVTSLTSLRSRSRALVRDSSYAKRARLLVMNNVVGNGMTMQAQVAAGGAQNVQVNEGIERAWKRWCEAPRCHTGGRLHFKMLERLAMGEVFEAGEVLIRLHPTRFADSQVPLGLEVIEAERLADELTSLAVQIQPGNEVRMGVELDPFHRPVAYHIRKAHPSEVRFGGAGAEWVERVPAEQIIHLAVIDRWPQTRGEPWMHTVARRMNDMDGYSEAEIIRARAQASMAGAIETPEESASFGEEQADGSVEMVMEAGVFKRLNPGEVLSAVTPTSPNAALDGFMRYMLREVAAGTGPSYESLSRDYSQSNYSSSRLARLDDIDLWRFVQAWFVTDFRNLIHREWLKMAVLSRAIPEIGVADYLRDVERFEAVRFRPRGWSWVDPTKEVNANTSAVRSGFATVTDVLAAQGVDFDEWLQQRVEERDKALAAGLVLDTDPDQVSAAGLAQAEPTAPAKDDDDEPPRRMSLLNF